jgi:YVTN family beta-propeller protein
VGNPIQVGDGPKEVALGLGAAWVANTDSNTVTRIDARSGKIVGAPIPTGKTPVGIAVGDGAVWVANNRDDTVTRIRP